MCIVFIAIKFVSRRKSVRVCVRVRVRVRVRTQEGEWGFTAGKSTLPDGSNDGVAVSVFRIRTCVQYSIHVHPCSGTCAEVWGFILFQRSEVDGPTSIRVCLGIRGPHDSHSVEHVNPPVSVTSVKVGL